MEIDSESAQWNTGLYVLNFERTTMAIKLAIAEDNNFLLKAFWEKLSFFSKIWKLKFHG